MDGATRSRRAWGTRSRRTLETVRAAGVPPIRATRRQVLTRSRWRSRTDAMEPDKRASSTSADRSLAFATPHRGDRGLNALRVLDVHILRLLSGRNAADQPTVHSAERFPIARRATRRRAPTATLSCAALRAWRGRRCLLTAQGPQPRFQRTNFAGQFGEIARDLAWRDATFSHETIEDIGSLPI